MNGFFKCIAMQEAARVNDADAMEDVYHGIC